MENHGIKGNFSGYVDTKYQVFHWYIEINLVKTYKRVVFDELIHYLDYPDYNSKQLIISIGYPIPEDM